LLNTNDETLDESFADAVITSIEFIVLAGAFAFTPPPTIYLIVKVVLEGANPYDFVNKKLDGS